MDTIIRWAGSKRQLLAKLKSHWPGGKARYVEPFCGSACLFFDLEPKKAILCDLNSDLMTAYQAIRTDPKRVLRCLRQIKHGKKSYYQLRRVNPAELTSAAQAARFLFLNRYCFNGIYRTNAKGEFNVPYGTRRNRSRIDGGAILEASRLLKRATLINGDFALSLERVRKGDFVYLDPPYAVRRRKIFSEYHPESFSVADLQRLSQWLRELDRRGASFVISYADSAEARQLLATWRPRRVWTKRHVAGFAGDRRGAYEILATNMITHAE